MLKWLDNKSNLDLDQEKIFFEPHYGFANLPGIIKSVSDALNGQKMSLRKALEKIKSAASQMPIKLIVTNSGANNGKGSILLRLGKDGKTTHIHRLIRFRTP